MPAIDALELYKQQNEVSDETSPLSDVLLKRDQATSFLEKRNSYFTSGISCECCYHMCSVSEMRGYCRNPVAFSFNIR